MLRHALSFFAVIVLATACAATTEQKIVNAVPAGATCVEDVIEDVTTSFDLMKTMADCAVTAEDVWNIVTTWKSKQSETASASTRSMAKMAKADKMLAAVKDYKASHAK